MKKIAMFFAAAAIAVSANAQKTALTGMQPADNIYVGVNAGATTVSKSGIVGDGAFEAYNPVFGIRVGKNFSPIFGLQLDAQMEMSAHKKECIYTGSKTFIQNVTAGLNATWNFSNIFAGYKGEPRFFEVIGVTGLGWAHAVPSNWDGVYAKGAIDFAFNFGAAKEWQAYVEPAIIYGAQEEINTWKFDARNANVQLTAGVNYKFGNSNGTHNFAIEQLRDQAEIDGLNAKINSLRSDVDAAKAAAKAKDAKIAELQKALTDCQNKPAPVVEKKAANLQPSVVFAQGKSKVENSQMANIQMIANYMKANPNAKVKISGYASPEGKAEFNQKLSEARAAAVKDILVKKYKIAANRLETEGLGATDKLFDEVEFNRVALFNDTNK